VPAAVDARAALTGQAPSGIAVPPRALRAGSRHDQNGSLPRGNGPISASSTRNVEYARLTDKANTLAAAHRSSDLHGASCSLGWLSPAPSR